MHENVWSGFFIAPKMEKEKGALIMMNCLQVKSILCSTQEELQDSVNEVLATLGDRVHDVHFFVPLTEGFAANVLYWSQDVPAAITAKCEEFAEENPGSEPLFVAVMTESKREWTYNALSHMIRLCQKNVETKERDIYASIIKRFEAETEEEPE